MKRTDFIRLASVIGVMLLGLFLEGCPWSSGTKTSPSPTPVPTEMGVMVTLTDALGTDPDKPELSSSKGTDHVRWSNKTTLERTISFTVDWPFMGTKADIVVAAGAESPWYTLDPAKVSGGGRSFPYQVTPPFTGPPDEPEISGQP